MKPHSLLFLLLFALLLVDQTPAQRSKQEDINKKCLASSGAKSETITQVRSGKFSNDPQIQKYFGCTMRSVGVINKSGQLQVAVLKTKVPKDMKRNEAMKIFLNCKDKKGSNPDETGYLLYKCFWEASPRHLQIDTS